MHFAKGRSKSSVSPMTEFQSAVCEGVPSTPSCTCQPLFHYFIVLHKQYSGKGKAECFKSNEKIENFFSITSNPYVILQILICQMFRPYRFFLFK